MMIFACVNRLPKWHSYCQLILHYIVTKSKLKLQRRPGNQRDNLIDLFMIEPVLHLSNTDPNRTLGM